MSLEGWEEGAKACCHFHLLSEGSKLSTKQNWGQSEQTGCCQGEEWGGVGGRLGLADASVFIQNG